MWNGCLCDATPWYNTVNLSSHYKIPSCDGDVNAKGFHIPQIQANKLRVIMKCMHDSDKLWVSFETVEVWQGFVNEITNHLTFSFRTEAVKFTLVNNMPVKVLSDPRTYRWGDCWYHYLLHVGYFSAKVLIFMPAGILHPTLAFQSGGSTNDQWSWWF